ncbi:MAG: type II CAAX endopeptidase family protein [Bacillota bacterium]|nr:type II CAAX endopeptidase family protein [Bacillota bacterium]
MSELIPDENREGLDNQSTVMPAPSASGSVPDLRSALRLFLVVFIMLLLFGSIAQAWHFEYGMIITQVIFVLLPAIWYWRRYNLNQVVFSRLKPLQLRYLPVIVILAGAFWLLNMVFATGLVHALMEFGYEPIVVIEPPQNLREYLGYVVVLSIFAGICEEVLFRGTIMPSMENRGLVPAIVFSSLLFAMLHGSLLNLVSTFTLGLVMAVIVIKTGSLWGGIIYHMINNFIAVTYLFIAGQYETAAEVEPQGFIAALPILLLALAGAWFGLRLLHKQTGAEPLLKNRQGWFPRGWRYWPFFAGLVLFILMATLELAIGYKWIDLGGIQ